MGVSLPRAALALVLALACSAALISAPLPAVRAAAPPVQGLEQTSGENPFLILYPELRRAPAPPWLRPGVRVSYIFASATFARNPDDPTPSGSSLLQFDVVAQDQRSVVAVPTLYSTQGQGQPPTVLAYQAALPGVGEFWFAPHVLANAEAVAGEEFLVNRLPVEVEGKSYDVVRMHSVTEDGEQVWEFDEQTGLLVFYRQALYDAGGEQRSSIIMTLLGSRQVKLPWRFGSVPTWVKRGVEIDLAGSQIMDVGGPPYIPLPMAVNLRVSKVNTLWSEHLQTTWLNNQQLGQNMGATGVAQLFGGLWLPPEALAVLKAGDVLDRDRFNGVTTHVDTANAREIGISAQGPSVLTRYLYDARTGKLTGFYQEAHMLAGTQYTELVAQ